MTLKLNDHEAEVLMDALEKYIEFAEGDDDTETAQCILENIDECLD